MSLHQNIFGLIDARSRSVRTASIWMRLLHQLPVSANYLGFARPALHVKNFMSFLSAHAAGAAAAPALVSPPLVLSLFCVTPSGEPAVEIYLQ